MLLDGFLLAHCRLPNSGGVIIIIFGWFLRIVSSAVRSFWFISKSIITKLTCRIITCARMSLIRIPTSRNSLNFYARRIPLHVFARSKFRLESTLDTGINLADILIETTLSDSMNFSVYSLRKNLCTYRLWTKLLIVINEFIYSLWTKLNIVHKL